MVFCFVQKLIIFFKKRKNVSTGNSDTSVRTVHARTFISVPNLLMIHLHPTRAKVATVVVFAIASQQLQPFLEKTENSC